MNSILKKLLLLWSIFFINFLYADGTDIGIHFSDASVNESTNKMTFTVTIDELPLSLLSSVGISYETLDAEGTATADVDYVPEAKSWSNIILFTPYSPSLSKTIEIDILDDTIYEGSEYFYVQLSTTSNGYAIDADGKIKGTIIDDDTAPLELTLYNKSIAEGDSNNIIQFSANLNQPAPSGGVTLTYETEDGTAVVGEDYIATSGSMTIPAGTSNGLINVETIGDALPEGTESFKLKILSISTGTLANSESSCIIYDDDSIKVNISSSNVQEGSSGESNTMPFTIYLAKPYPLTTPLTINYQTADGSTPSATEGVDYIAKSGSVTFNQGDIEKIIEVELIEDSTLEPNEYLKMIISNSSYIVNDNAQSLIINDDGSYPSINFNESEVRIIEGDSGQQDLNFTLILSEPAPVDATFNYQTWNITAQNESGDNDFVYTGGTHTILAGTSTVTIPVKINGDTKIEDDEEFYFVVQNLVNLTDGTSNKIKGIIENDDGSYPTLSLAQSSYSITEGNSGQQELNISLTLDQPALADSTFNYFTQDNTAQSSDSDYDTVTTQTYTIPEGETNITLSVTINGDTKVEGDESFVLSINTPQNFRMTGNNLHLPITITNDDVDAYKFGCSIDAYIFGSTTFNSQTDAYSFDLTDGSELSRNLNIHPSNINAIGYNVTDDYIWGFDRANYKVVRVNSQYEVTPYDIAGLPTFYPANDTTPTYHAGDVSVDGILHLATIRDPNTIYRVDVNPNSANYLKALSEINLSTPVEQSDFAFSPTNNMIYTVNYDEFLIRINPSDGTVSNLGKLSIPELGNVISLFFDKEGSLYAHHTYSGGGEDSGKVYKITPPSTAQTLITATHFSTINATTHGDGARCINATVTPQSEEPFVCDDGMYISSSVNRENPTSSEKMWLHKIDTEQNPFEFSVLNTDGSSQFYNALAYSDNNNYIYGLYYKELIKLSNTGKVISLGNVDTLPDFLTSKQLFAGAIYGDDYYVSGPGQDYDKIFKIKLSDKSVTEVALDTAISLLDFSFTPDGQYLHGIVDGGKLVKINVATGHVEFIGTAHAGYQFDSTFSDNSGRFFANDSLGHGFFEFDLSTGTKLFLSDSQEAEFNDGANCLSATLVFTDYGDAPSSYGTPRHDIANGVFMGTEVDHDIHAYHNTEALGDDSNGIDDEDGVTLVDGNDLNGSYFTLDAVQELKIKASKDGYLNAWIDYGIDGVFDAGDKIVDAQLLTAGEQTISFNIPSGLTTNATTYLRFRFSSTANLDALQNASDGEVEDYAIMFGSAYTPFKGTFNIERTDSGTYAIDSDQRNAWYTQIVGRDFDYSILFYDENMTEAKEMDNITVKLELVDTESNSTLYARYAHIQNSPAVDRLDIVSGVNAPVNDLATLPASKDVHFRISYGIDGDGSIIQADCVGDPKSCFDNFTTTHTDLAQDNFAIRPESFNVIIADGKNTLDTTANPLRLASGYDYNLTVIASQYNDENQSSTNYNQALTRLLTFQSNTACANQDDHMSTETFKDGRNISDTNSSLFNLFEFNNVGHYNLYFEDKEWTQVDWNKTIPDCKLNNSNTINSGTPLVGCDIASARDLNISYYPHHFKMDFTMNNLPDSGHDNFIYMSQLDATYNEVAIQFEGTITAKSEDNITCTNFTNGCMAEDLFLAPNATVLSEDGIDQPLQTSFQDALTPNREDIDFRRMVRFNNDDNDTIYTSINRITNGFTIPANKFLVGENNGTTSLDLRYNIDKHTSRTINPIQIKFNSVIMDSIASKSSAEGIVENYIPTGKQVLTNNVRNFYFTQVAPDYVVFPIININNSSIVRTPLNVDIFCDKNTSYCNETNITYHTNINSSPRRDSGWYLSTEHETLNDGHIIQLDAVPDIVTIVPDENITFVNGRNGILLNTFINCILPFESTTVTITPTPALEYHPDPANHGFPTYTLPCSQNPSAWSGIGEVGNVIESNTTTSSAGKIDW